MLKNKLIIITSLTTTLLLTTASFAGWQDMLKDADKVLKTSTGKSTASNIGSTLSNDQISQGLKEALDVGVKTAVDMLGKKNGFLSDQAVKIMLPEEMETIEKLLRSAGQEEIIDDYVSSMNRAAEQAVPKVTDVFVDSISKMSLRDAQSILSGSDTAATDYFRKNTSKQLSQLINPYIKSAMDKNQVTQYYQSLSSTVKQYDSFGLTKKYLGDVEDINKYVTDKTLDGLFTKIADQEKLIRANPMARSTDILKDVFGSLGN
ncbi:MAG: DUF4197 domain-containing protein [gamma proteobacterium symbiont of Taylorina sp.]|nr:DUF4197 domain-containing protein [gamma proteobacterium symbiont of Taylorina sp.]